LIYNWRILPKHMMTRPNKTYKTRVLRLPSNEANCVASKSVRCRKTPSHLHVAAKILMAWSLNGSNLAACINELFNDLELRCASLIWMVCLMEGHARQLEVYLDFRANLIENFRIDLFKQHVELDVREVQIVAKWRALLRARPRHLAAPECSADEPAHRCQIWKNCSQLL